MNTKTFYYDKLLYFIDVKVTGIFCGIIILACLYLGIVGIVSRALVGLIALVALYTFWNCFIAKSTSQIVSINQQEIIFSALGREDHYPLTDIKKIRVREFPTGGKMYIRINNYGLNKGRYWIQFKKFNDSQELMKRVLDIEYHIHPDTLKARARRVNTEYLELKKQKAEQTVKG